MSGAGTAQKKHRAKRGVFLSYENKLSYQNPSPEKAGRAVRVCFPGIIPDNQRKDTRGPASTTVKFAEYLFLLVEAKQIWRPRGLYKIQPTQQRRFIGAADGHGQQAGG